MSPRPTRPRGDVPLRLVQGGGAAASESLSFVPGLALSVAEPEALHPLTTRDAPLLPPRGAAGTPADVWEELDRAAAWVCDGWAGDAREEVRHALRVLCVALRGAELGPDAGPPLRVEELPWQVPVAELAGRLRRRLVDQALQGGTGAKADAAAVLAVAAALDRLEHAARADGARSVVDQLGGVQALELLIEVAHDMRSPLGSILFLVERLRAGGTLAPAQDRQLGLVYGAAFGLTTVVGDVMELARGGERLTGGEATPMRVSSVAEEVRAIVAPVAEEKGLALVIDVAVRDARLGRAAALHRVLLNLVTNALKFTPAGTVALRAAEGAGDDVVFTIEDTGRGIPPRVLAQLFQTFRQRPDARDHAFSSAGLGLAICQRLVGAMGGELDVDSALDRGTRFRFTLTLPRASLV